jgi:hypothetical protein
LSGDTTSVRGSSTLNLIGSGASAYLSGTTAYLSGSILSLSGVTTTIQGSTTLTLSGDTTTIRGVTALSLSGATTSIRGSTSLFLSGATNTLQGANISAYGTTSIFSGSTTTIRGSSNLYLSGTAVTIQGPVSLTDNITLANSTDINFGTTCWLRLSATSTGIAHPTASYYLQATAAGWMFAGGVSAPSYTVTSDKKEKRSFKSLPFGMNFILQSQPYAYYLKNNIVKDFKDNLYFGFIAQDIEQLLGKLVGPNAHYSIVTREKKLESLEKPEELCTDQDFSYSLSYTQFIPILTKAFQELYQEFSEEKAERAESHKTLTGWLHQTIDELDKSNKELNQTKINLEKTKEENAQLMSRIDKLEKDVSQSIDLLSTALKRIEHLETTVSMLTLVENAL